MPPHDTPRGRTDGPRREHELALAQRQRLRSRHARVAHPAVHGQAEDERPHTRTLDHGDDRQVEQDPREREEHVDDAHDELVDAPADGPGQGPDGDADGRAHRHGDHGDDQGQPGAGEHGRQEVHAVLVRPEEVRGARAQEPRIQVAQGRRKRSEPRSCEGREQEHEEQRRARPATG